MTGSFSEIPLNDGSKVRTHKTADGDHAQVVELHEHTDLLYQYLSSNGDGTGTINLNGNYAGAPAQFYIAPPAGKVFHIERILVCLEDTNGFSASEYGNTGGPLTNGATLQKRVGATTVAIDFTSGYPVKTNTGWASFCYDTDLKTWGGGNELLVVRWTFGRTGGSLRLDGDAVGGPDRLTVILNDDLTGLVGHMFQVQGYVV